MGGKKLLVVAMEVQRTYLQHLTKDLLTASMREKEVSLTKLHFCCYSNIFPDGLSFKYVFG